MPYAACRLRCPLLHRLAYRLFHKRTALLAVQYAARLGPGPGASPAAAAAGPGRPTTAAAATGDPRGSGGSGAGGGGKGSGGGGAAGTGGGTQAPRTAGRTERPAGSEAGGREAGGRARRVNAVEAERQDGDAGSSGGGDGGGGFVNDAWSSDGDDGEWLVEAAGAGGVCVHSDAADRAAIRGGDVGDGVGGADAELRRDVRHALQLSQVHAPAWLASLAFALHPVHTEVS